MKARDLIELLGQFDGEMEVMFEHPSNDYWHTQLASEVSQVSERTVRYAVYHSQFVLAEQREDAADRSDDPHKEVILIG